MKKFFCSIAVFLSVMMLLSACSAISRRQPADNADNKEKANNIVKYIAKCEENGCEVVESIVSSDGLVALLAESESYGGYLQLYVYDKSGDCFVPMFEPQVKSGEVTAAEGGGFTVECDSGTYFVGKNESGKWNIHGNGTPFGAGPQAEE